MDIDCKGFQLSGLNMMMSGVRELGGGASVESEIICFYSEGFMESGLFLF